MRIIFLCLTFVSGLISCREDTLGTNSFWQCNALQNPDSAAVSANLSGSWTWARQSCFWTGNSTSADKNVKVVFNSNHSFLVIINSNMLTQGTWKLVQTDGNAWGLDMSSPVEYLHGRILFCEKQVLFNDSYRDGCDNLFNKSN